MSYSTQRAVSDGSLALLDINIEYFDREEITVYFDSVQDAYPWNWVGTTDNQLAFSPAVPIGIEVLVKRTTDISEPRHLFNAGAAFTEATLDEVLLQNLRIAQEAKENATIEEVFTNLNMHGYKMTNVGDPVNQMDAVNLRSFAPHDAQILVYLGECEDARDAAEASAVEAANSAASVNAANLAQRDGTNAVGKWSIDISGTAAEATHALDADNATNATHAATAGDADTADLANAIADGAVSSTAKIANGVVTPAKLAQMPNEASGNVAGTSVFEVTYIPTWVTEVTVVFQAVVPSTSNQINVRIGSGTYVVSGYTCIAGTNQSNTPLATGFPVTPGAFTTAYTGVMRITRVSNSSTFWVATASGTINAYTSEGAGSVDAGGAMNRVAVMLTGAGTFSGGTVTIKYR